MEEMTFREAAGYLDVTGRQLRRLVGAGRVRRIDHVRSPGRDWRFRKGDLDTFLGSVWGPWRRTRVAVCGMKAGDDRIVVASRGVRGARGITFVDIIETSPGKYLFTEERPVMMSGWTAVDPQLIADAVTDIMARNGGWGCCP